MRYQNGQYGPVMDELAFSRDDIDMSASSVIQFAGLARSYGHAYGSN